MDNYDDDTVEFNCEYVIKKYKELELSKKYNLNECSVKLIDIGHIVKKFNGKPLRAHHIKDILKNQHQN